MHEDFQWQDPGWVKHKPPRIESVEADQHFPHLGWLFNGNGCVCVTLTRKSEEKHWYLMDLYDIHEDAKVPNIWFLVRSREDDEGRIGEGGKGGVKLKQPCGDAQAGRAGCVEVEQLVSPEAVFKVFFGHVCRSTAAKVDLFREEDGEPFIIGPGLKEGRPASAKGGPPLLKPGSRALVHQQGKGGEPQAAPCYVWRSEDGGVGEVSIPNHLQHTCSIADEVLRGGGVQSVRS